MKSVQSALSDLLTTSATHGTFSRPSTKRGLILMYVNFIYSWLKKRKKREKLHHILIQYIKNDLQSSSPKETNLNQLELLSLIVPEAA